MNEEFSVQKDPGNLLKLSFWWGAGPMGCCGSAQKYLTPAEAAKCTELLERGKTDVKGPLGKSVMIRDEF